MMIADTFDANASIAALVFIVLFLVLIYKLSP